MYLLKPPPDQTLQQVSSLQGLFFQQFSYYLAFSLEKVKGRKKWKKTIGYMLIPLILHRNLLEAQKRMGCLSYNLLLQRYLKRNAVSSFIGMNSKWETTNFSRHHKKIWQQKSSQEKPITRPCIIHAKKVSESIIFNQSQPITGLNLEKSKLKK